MPPTGGRSPSIPRAVTEVAASFSGTGQTATVTAITAAVIGGADVIVRGRLGGGGSQVGHAPTEDWVV